MKWTRLNNTMTSDTTDTTMDINECVINSIDHNHAVSRLKDEFISFNEKAHDNDYNATTYIEEAMNGGVLSKMLKSISDITTTFQDNYNINRTRETNIRSQVIDMNANSDKINLIKQMYMEKGSNGLKDKKVTMREYQVDHNLLKARAVLATHSLAKFYSMIDFDLSKTSLSKNGLLDMAREISNNLHDIFGGIIKGDSTNELKQYIYNMESVKTNYRKIYNDDALGYNYQVILKRSYDSYFDEHGAIHKHVSEKDLELIKNIISDSKLKELKSVSHIISFMKDKLCTPNNKVTIQGDELYEVMKTYFICNNIICVDTSTEGDNQKFRVDTQDEYVKSSIKSIHNMIETSKRFESKNKPDEDVISAISEYTFLLMKMLDTLNGIYTITTMMSEFLIKEFNTSLNKLRSAVKSFDMTEQEKINLGLLLAAVGGGLLLML